MVRGRPVACLRCQSTTHLRRECDAIRCDRCRRWGRHLPADCPTPASWATRSAPEVVVVDVELVDEDADGRPHGASISPPGDATVVAMDIIGSVSRAVSPGTAGAVPAPTGAADVGSTVVSGPPLRRADTTSGHTATALSVTGVVLKESAPPVPSSYTGRPAGPSLSSVGGEASAPLPHPMLLLSCGAMHRRRLSSPSPRAGAAPPSQVVSMPSFLPTSRNALCCYAYRRRERTGSQPSDRPRCRNGEFQEDAVSDSYASNVYLRMRSPSPSLDSDASADVDVFMASTREASPTWLRRTCQAVAKSPRMAGVKCPCRSRPRSPRHHQD